MKRPIMMAVNQSRHWAWRLLMKGENEAKRRMKRIPVSLNEQLARAELVVHDEESAIKPKPVSNSVAHF
ncbi:hypothetical protein [Paenibacillus sp. MER TA 81-3]|uniref:hypothetical protein n=1 Tax=Paenibacillus sp. MER TA 81-3 TaxID=2939573 RepID=UPI00203DBD74|nr:hypothetical protein [Paenibacillus sp. MER TA 81-3]